MITNLKYIAAENALITYVKDGTHHTIQFKEASNIWPQLTPETFEGGRVKAYGSLIVFTAIIASGQGVALFMYDTKIHSFPLVLRCDYCQDFLLLDDMLVTLHTVSNFTTPFHLQVYVQPMNYYQPKGDRQRVYCEAPQKVHFTTPGECHLVLEDTKLFVVVGSNKYLYSSDIHNITNQMPNPEHSLLYKTWDSDMAPDKIVLLDMLT